VGFETTILSRRAAVDLRLWPVAMFYSIKYLSADVCSDKILWLRKEQDGAVLALQTLSEQDNVAVTSWRLQWTELMKWDRLIKVYRIGLFSSCVLEPKEFYRMWWELCTDINGAVRRCGKNPENKRSEVLLVVELEAVTELENIFVTSQRSELEKVM